VSEGQWGEGGESGGVAEGEGGDRGVDRPAEGGEPEAEQYVGAVDPVEGAEEQAR
jgi:hypothetical protein